MITKAGRVAIVSLLLVCLVEAGVILTLNGGTLTYTLDDAYVHLAVAESIPRGVYGLDTGSPGSPSSSVLWPFFLVPVAATTAGALAPLLLNLIAASGTLLLLDRLTAGMSHDLQATGPAARRVLLLGAIPALNLVGLAFTGMEHSLQVLAAVGCAAGLAAGSLAADDAASPTLESLYRWVPLWIVVGPLLRYENLALSLPAMVLLWVWGRRRAAALSGTLVAAAVATFSAFLRLTGQGWLPTSVTAKTDFGFPGLAGLVSQLQRNTTDRQGALLSVGIVLLAVAAADRMRPTRERQLAGWGIVAMLLHMVFGRFGWFSRYEIYIWSVALVLAVFLWRKAAWALLSRPRGVLVAALLVAALCLPYLYSLVLTPLAAHNIHLQHVQMHRFATRFLEAPVAANDVGRLAYRNPHTVVDLAGLGNRAALMARRDWRGPEWMDRMAADAGADVALVYESWYPELPEGWVKLAELRMQGPRITPSDTVVSVFAREPAVTASVREALARFAPTLPAGVRLEMSGTALERRPGATPPGSGDVP